MNGIEVDKDLAAMLHALVLVSRYHINNQNKKWALIEQFITEYDSSLTIDNILAIDPIHQFSTNPVTLRRYRFARYMVDMIEIDANEPPCLEHLLLASRVTALLLGKEAKNNTL